MAKILICDDEKAARRIFEIICDEFGVIGKSVETPSEVLEEIRTAGYQMIFLDIENLPQGGNSFRGDAYTYARRVREMSGATIIGISGWGEEYFKRDGAEEYFDEIVDKPKIMGRNDNDKDFRELLEKYHLI